VTTNSSVIDIEREKRRNKVADLLCRGSNAKMQRASSDRALGLLLEAHRLAHLSPGVRDPWRALTSYRLAHLRLRQSMQTLDDLLETDELLAEATRCRELGPWPHLYRLAVLHRIRLADESIVSERRIEEHFLGARAVLSQHACDEETPRRARLQDPLFNSLELCSYFLGRPYTALEGLRGELDDPLGAHEDWSFVCPDPDSGKVRYSRALALAELRAVAEENPAAICFVIEEDGSAWCTRGSEGSKRSLGEHTAKLLARLLRWPRKPVECAFGDEPSAETKRKRCQRFRTELAALTGLLASAFQADGGGVQLPEQIGVFGACSPAAWR
jgi:hypothetical protein